jgi:hypothetical protein
MIVVRLIKVIFLVFSTIGWRKLRWSLRRGVFSILSFFNNLDAVALHIHEEGDVVWEQVFFPTAKGHTNRHVRVSQRSHVDANGAPHLTGREEKAIRMAKGRRHTQELDPYFLKRFGSERVTHRNRDDGLELGAGQSKTASTNSNAKALLGRENHSEVSKTQLAHLPVPVLIHQVLELILHLFNR